MGLRAVLLRWVAFNGVGVLGAGVQLLTLALLLTELQLHYVPATIVAVETALLHNFIWHQRWTWRDRAAGLQATCIRLGRFHLLNGSVSLIGNTILVSVLSGLIGLDPIVSNIVAILSCSIVNFVASEVLVFRTATVLMLVLAGTPHVRLAADTDVADLRAHTVAAWQEYERVVDARYGALGATAGPFFVHDEFGSPGNWREAARSRGITMLRIERASRDAPEPSIRDGKIHHWAGAVFVPGLTLDRVLRHLREHAGEESRAYEDVLASRLLHRDGDRLKVFLKLRRESVITVTYNTEHEVQYRRLSPTRASSRSTATKIAELADPGTPDEREKPAGRDNGFLWRLNAYWRYEQVEGGVLIECESVSLSRGVPALLKVFISGTVERIARESLEKTLTSLRRVLLAPDGKATRGVGRSAPI